MIILKRWKAILSWASVSALIAQGGMWLVNLYPPNITPPPHMPEWIAVFFLLVGACGGASYCVSTDEEREEP